ncbi:MAG: patatin-like phospholipase family protein, partial [Polaromonas sp.]
GEKAALAVMPQIRARIAQLQAERAQAAHLAQQQAEKQAAEAQYTACLEQRSRLQKLAGMAGLEGGCATPW